MVGGHDFKKSIKNEEDLYLAGHSVISENTDDHNMLHQFDKSINGGEQFRPHGMSHFGGSKYNQDMSEERSFEKSHDENSGTQTNILNPINSQNEELNQKKSTLTQASLK